ALQTIVRQSKCIASIERSVANEFKKVSMKLVRARLGDCIYHGRGMISILRRQRAGLDLELLQRVRKWKGQVQIVEWIVVRRSIEQVSQTRRQASCNSNNDRGIVPVRCKPAIDVGVCGAG